MNRQFPNTGPAGENHEPVADRPGPPAGDGNRDRVPWTGRDVFTIIGMVVAVFLSIFFLIEIFAAFFGPGRSPDGNSGLMDSAVTVAALLFTQWAIMIGVALAYLRSRGYNLNARVLGFRRTRFWPAAGWLVVVLIATSSFEQLYDSLIEKFAGESQLPSQVPSQDVTALFGTSVIALILTFVTVALITPVVEELFFRGIVHRGLEQRFGFFPGATLSAFIFCLAHLDYRLFVPIFGLGFGFAFLVHRTGSILPTITGHFIVNALGVVAQFIDPSNS